MNFHMWLKNWGWFKASDPSTMERTKEFAKEYFDNHIALAVQLNKPATLEKFGFVRDGETFSPEDPITYRDEFYGYILGLIYDSMKEGGPIAGINFWSWGGEGRAEHSNHQWNVGDTSYTGDPYSEKQGLNSVYNTDASTLKILSDYSKKLSSVGMASEISK